MKRLIQVFLCHASEDKAVVREVYDRLVREGLAPWLDEESLLPGQHWDEEIRMRLQQADFILIFISQHSVNKRGYVQREIKLALELLDEMPEGRILVIPVRIDKSPLPKRLHHLYYCNLFDESGIEKVIRAIRSDMLKLGIAAPIRLRSKPAVGLSDKNVSEMIRKNGFYERDENPSGYGIAHQYNIIKNDEAWVVIDGLTGLMWQRSGSSLVTFKNAVRYIQYLNRSEFAGKKDWRLPTLEEAFSLMEPFQDRSARKNESPPGLDWLLYEGELLMRTWHGHIDSLFDTRQCAMWTSDKTPDGQIWIIGFEKGICGRVAECEMSMSYVRAIRDLLTSDRMPP